MPGTRHQPTRKHSTHLFCLNSVAAPGTQRALSCTWLGRPTKQSVKLLLKPGPIPLRPCQGLLFRRRQLQKPANARILQPATRPRSPKMPSAAAPLNRRPQSPNPRTGTLRPTTPISGRLLTIQQTRWPMETSGQRNILRVPYRTLHRRYRAFPRQSRSMPRTCPLQHRSRPRVTC